MSDKIPSPPNISFDLGKLIRTAAVEPVHASQYGDVVITSITDDSRRVSPGAMFVAVKGTAVDGHEFLREAVAQGASAVVIDQTTPTSVTESATNGHCVAVLRVSNPPAALAKLSAAYYQVGANTPNECGLIGITGTNGKTTVAWLLRSIFQTADRPTALLGTIEYDLVGRRTSAPLTTPGAVLLCEHLAEARHHGAKWGILEVSSHALAQHRTDGLSFRIGVFTNLSGDHLDYHGDMSHYAQAKHRLFDQLNPDATAVVNVDDPAAGDMVTSTRAKVVSFAMDTADTDWRAVIEHESLAGARFSVTHANGHFTVESRLVGRHNVSNALAAIAAAGEAGVDVADIRAGIERVVEVPGRMQRVEPADWPYSVFVDYAHTDDALSHALQTLRSLTKNRLICVFGCGGDRDRSKRPRMGAAATRYADIAVVTSDNPRGEQPRAIINDILSGMKHRKNCSVEVEPDRRRAIEFALAQAGRDDCVLIAGKGHEDYQLIGDEVLPFDDAAVARALLNAHSRKEIVA